jgi:hypothetical protein
MDSMTSFLFYCGTMYSQRGLYAMAKYSFEVGANFGHVPSIRELGILYIKGHCGEIDIYEGSRLLHLAEQAGDDTASIILDSYLEF